MTGQQEDVRCPHCGKLIFKVMVEEDIHVDLQTVCPRCKGSFIWNRRRNVVGQVLLRSVYGTAP